MLSRRYAGVPAELLPFDPLLCWNSSGITTARYAVNGKTGLKTGSCRVKFDKKTLRLGEDEWVSDLLITLEIGKNEDGVFTSERETKVWEPFPWELDANGFARLMIVCWLYCRKDLHLVDGKLSPEKALAELRDELKQISRSAMTEGWVKPSDALRGPGRPKGVTDETLRYKNVFDQLRSENPKLSTNILVEKVVDVTGGTGRRWKYERRAHREKVRKALQRAGCIAKTSKNGANK